VVRNPSRAHWNIPPQRLEKLFVAHEVTSSQFPELLGIERHADPIPRASKRIQEGGGREAGPTEPVISRISSTTSKVDIPSPSATL